MAHSNKLKTQVLSALAAGKSYSELTAEFGVSSSTVRGWEGKGKKPLRIATQPATVTATPESTPTPQQSEPPTPAPRQQASEQRNAIINKAVLDDIAEIRRECRAELASKRKLALRRIEDSILPFRRRKVRSAPGEPERTELDPTYAPPKIDLTAALYILNDVIGVNVGAAIEQVDEEPSAVEIHVVRDEVPENLQLPRPSAPTGTGA